jgi:hypothetical protein
VFVDGLVQQRRPWVYSWTRTLRLNDAYASNLEPIKGAFAQAVADYQNAGKMLVNDVVWATMFYGTQSYLTQSYVRGVGYNSLYDYNWEGIRLVSH